MHDTHPHILQSIPFKLSSFAKLIQTTTTIGFK